MNEAKQKLVLPTLLRGKLVDYFIELNEETKEKPWSSKTSPHGESGFD